MFNSGLAIFLTYISLVVTYNVCNEEFQDVESYTFGKYWNYKN